MGSARMAREAKMEENLQHGKFDDDLSSAQAPS